MLARGDMDGCHDEPYLRFAVVKTTVLLSRHGEAAQPPG